MCAHVKTYTNIIINEHVKRGLDNISHNHCILLPLLHLKKDKLFMFIRLVSECVRANMCKRVAVDNNGTDNDLVVIMCLCEGVNMSVIEIC